MGMLDAIKPLLESDLINDETRTAISEAWEAKLDEAREHVRAELREEFAQRYEHDKSVMVEALDKMVTDGLGTEIQQLQAEKQAIVEDRVKQQQKLKRPHKQKLLLKHLRQLKLKRQQQPKHLRQLKHQHKHQQHLTLQQILQHQP